MQLTARVAAVGAGALVALALTACNGSGGDDSAKGSSSIAPATVRTANCDAWNAASADERGQLVQGMRTFFGGQVDTPGVVGKALPDDKATKLFDSYCAQPYAGSFTLYRLYGNAAAFTNPQK